MQPVPIKPEISIEDLEKLDIRVGTIKSVADVPDSKKLMKLTVDFGDHSRTILAGIKQERADPHEITGLQALFVVNLREQALGEAALAQVDAARELWNVQANWQALTACVE